MILYFQSSDYSARYVLCRKFLLHLSTTNQVQLFISAVWRYYHSYTHTTYKHNMLVMFSPNMSSLNWMAYSWNSLHLDTFLRFLWRKNFTSFGIALLNLYFFLTTAKATCGCQQRKYEYCKWSFEYMKKFDSEGNKYACYQEIVYSFFWLMSTKIVLYTTAMDIASVILEIIRNKNCIDNLG